jgi:superkiller protein 3
MVRLLASLVLVILFGELLSSPELIFQEGNAHFAKGNYQEAIKAYKQTIELDPTFSGAYANLGNGFRALSIHIESQNGRNDDFDPHLDKLLREHKQLALAAFEQATELSPTRARNHFNLGVAYAELDRIENAAESYRKALALDSKHLNAHYNLGVLLQENPQLMKKPDEQLSCYSNVLQLDTHHVSARLNMCNVVYARGDFSLAERCYGDVLRLDSDHLLALGNMVAVLQLRDDLEGARKMAQRIVALDPTNALGRYTIAALSGDTTAAEETALQ